MSVELHATNISIMANNKNVREIQKYKQMANNGNAGEIQKPVNINSEV